MKKHSWYNQVNVELYCNRSSSLSLISAVKTVGHIFRVVYCQTVYDIISVMSCQLLKCMTIIRSPLCFQSDYVCSCCVISCSSVLCILRSSRTSLLSAFPSSRLALVLWRSKTSYHFIQDAHLNCNVVLPILDFLSFWPAYLFSSHLPAVLSASDLFHSSALGRGVSKLGKTIGGRGCRSELISSINAGAERDSAVVCALSTQFYTSLGISSHPHWLCQT